MTLLAKGAKDFEKPSTGSAQGVCINVFDLGMQKTSFNGEDTGIKHQIVIRWELLEKMKEGNFAGQPFLITKKYSLSLHEKSNLRKDLEAWLGIAFTEDQIINGFDLDVLVGKSCLLSIANTSTGNVKVATVMAMPQGMAEFKPTAISNKVPKWIQEAIDTQIKFKEQGDDPAEPTEPEENVPPEEYENIPF